MKNLNDFRHKEKKNWATENWVGKAKNIANFFRLIPVIPIDQYNNNNNNIFHIYSYPMQFICFKFSTILNM